MKKPNIRAARCVAGHRATRFLAFCLLSGGGALVASGAGSFPFSAASFATSEVDGPRVEVLSGGDRGARRRTTAILPPSAAEVGFGPFRATEGEGAFLDLWRDGDTNTAFRVDWTTTGEPSPFRAVPTALPGIDYLPAQGTVAFAPGQRYATLAVPLLDDGTVDSPEVFQVRITGLSGDVRLRGDASAWVVLRDNERATPSIDPSFHPDFVPFSPGHRLEPDRRVALPGGGFAVLIAAAVRNGWGTLDDRESSILLYDGDGRMRTVIRLHLQSSEGEPSIGRLRVAADGRFLVGGMFDRANGSRTPGLVRLDPSGVPDEAFRPPEDLLDRAHHRGPRVLCVQPDGKIVVVPGAGDRIVRLFPDGRPDLGFAARLAEGEALDAWPHLDGRLLIRVQRSAGVEVVDSLVRLNADGSMDSGFRPSSSSLAFGVPEMGVQSDGSLLVSAVLPAEGTGGVGGTQVVRWKPDGSVDGTFHPPAEAAVFAGLLPGGRIAVVAGGRLALLEPDGTRVATYPGFSLEDTDDGWGAPWVVPSPSEDAFLAIFPSTRLEAETLGINHPDERPRDGVEVIRTLVRGTPSRAIALAGRLITGAEGDFDVLVRRYGDTSEAARVRYKTRDGSAVAGRDYTAGEGVVEFAPRETSKQLTLGGLRPSAAGTTFYLDLSQPEGCEIFAASRGIRILGAISEIDEPRMSLERIGPGAVRILVPQFVMDTDNASIEVSSELGSWLPLPRFTDEHGGWMDFDAVGARHRFYRVQADRPVAPSIR